MDLLKHVAFGRLYRPMFVVAAGSVDLREANSVSRKQACLSDRRLSNFVLFFSFSNLQKNRRREQRDARSGSEDGSARSAPKLVLGTLNGNSKSLGRKGHKVLV